MHAMKPYRTFAVALLLAGAALPLRAEDGISVENAWARAGTSTGAVYLTMQADHPDRLVGVATPAADATSLHTSMNESGIVRMRPVEAIPLEPGKKVALEPGGLHIMLERLKRPLKEGDSFPLTLTFEKGGTRQLDVRVEKAGARAPTHSGGMRHGT
jgi:periplasmic copper chaperone A